MSPRPQVDRLIFDVETAAMPRVEDWVPEPRVPANVKDPAKVEAIRAEKRAAVIEGAALDPDLATVRLITAQVAGAAYAVLVPAKRVAKGAAARLADAMRGEVAGAVGRDRLAHAFQAGWSLQVMPEVDALRWFWMMLTTCNGCSVGFNTLSFDLPMLMRRSMDLAVRVSPIPALAKYRDAPTTDLMGLLFNWSWEGGKRLKWLAKRYGLDTLVEGADGADVAGMTDAELVAYGLSDLHVTAQLYRAMNGVYFDHAEAE